MADRIILSDEHESIADRYRNGETLQQIGRDYGVSRERIRQIVTKQGCNSFSGGASVRALLNAIHRPKSTKAEQACMSVYGCSIDRRTEINAGLNVCHKGSPALRYREQRRNAIGRGIDWEITFPEWWSVWQESGNWEQRGRGYGFCMARIGDTGPYSKDNVEIKTCAENSAESYYKTPVSDRIAKRQKKTKHLCIRGHLLVPENRTSAGNCKKCESIRHKAYNLRKAAKKLANQVDA